MKLRGKENFTWDNLKSKKVKTYSDFCEIGLTHSGKKGMAGKRGLVHFIHYNIGVRLAYLAWILGLSANTFTFIRLLMTLTGFLLIFDSSYITKYIYFFSYPDIFYRLFGVSLIFVQKAMDGGDGALSRVNQSSSPNGREADVMVDFGSKMMVIPILAYISDISLFVLLSGMACYMFYCSDQWSRHDSYGLPRIYIIEFTKNPNFQDFNENHPVPKPFINVFFTFPFMTHLIPASIAVLGVDHDYSSLICMYLFTFYFTIITYKYLLILNSKEVVSDKKE